MSITMTAPQNITVDPEFASLMPELHRLELDQLHADLEADGCLEALVVWDTEEQLILLDGHHRFAWCKDNGASYRIKKLEFSCREEAFNWMINHQLGRRNISNLQRTYLLGKLYSDQKPVNHRPKKGDTMSPLSSEAIAAAHGVSDRTVQRAAHFAVNVDTIGETSPDLREAILADRIETSAPAIADLAESPAKIKAAAKRAKAGDKNAIVAPKKNGREAVSTAGRKDAIKGFGKIVRFIASIKRMNDAEAHRSHPSDYQGRVMATYNGSKCGRGPSSAAPDADH